jgi:glycolate oxidase subunit GlcD
MVERQLVQNLQQIVGKDNVLISRAESELYSYDASLARGGPGVVVLPATTGEVSRVVQAAQMAGVDWVPRGFGTNLSGGTVMPGSGIVVGLTRFNRILEINPSGRYAVVQPGVTNLELQTALADVGFFYAPDPASQKVATLGGNVGENSGGPHCLKYGVTTNHILMLEAVLADGRIVRLGAPALDPPGYDLRGVFIGSEGTLAIVTEVMVRIMPKPEMVITLLAVYDSIADAARSVADITAAGIVPATLEMMDAPIIHAVEDSFSCGYPRDAAAVLIIEVEGPAAGLQDQSQRIRELCTRNKCRNIRQAKDDAERNRLWEGRRGAFGAVARLAPNYLVNDGTVPRDRLPEALSKVAAVVRDFGFDHGNVFHAGDGNLHPLIFFDSRDADQLARVEKAGWQIMQTCADLGGTISGEHGIGKEKIDAMRMVFSEADLAAQRGLKAAFDSEHRLNPGKVIPPPLRSGDTDPYPPQCACRPPSDVAGELTIQEQVITASSNRAGLLPLGSGSLRDFGNCDSRPLDVVESRNLSGIVEHNPANQVVTAGAGMLLAELQQFLADHNQWLPLRPPLAGTAHSLGGIVALGHCGPERMAYGAPRDLTLGLRLISGEGQSINAGGRVVKNVAGYDMTRLIVGSAGTLGVITQATFRVAAIPEQCRVLKGRGALADCSRVALELLASDNPPIFAVGLPGAAADSADTWTLGVGFEGFGLQVTAQLDRLARLYARSGLMADTPESYDLYDGWIGPQSAHLVQGSFLCRIHCRPDRLQAFLAECVEYLPKAVVWVDFGSGCIWAAFDMLDAAQWNGLTQTAVRHQGHALLVKATDKFKQAHDVFGPPQTGWTIMHRIKAVLDPHHIFCPGRMPGRV